MMMLDIDIWVCKSEAQERSGDMIQNLKLIYKAMKMNEITWKQQLRWGGGFTVAQNNALLSLGDLEEVK